jgi:hypothetical protein
MQTYSLGYPHSHPVAVPKQDDLRMQDLWPGDVAAKQAIDVDIGIPCGAS